ncbi:MAG: protoporphyrinogen oxidase, partial [Proteobacteria bacterium]|nr:protoporphyrinogen oxidase [Pseudomonadota bacterium]
MAHVLVIYASTEGQTVKIATYVADRCGQAGNATHIRQASDLTPLPAFDAVVLAGSLHLGKHQPALVDFVVEHREQLAAVPSLFLSVSLSAAGGDEDLIN